MFYRIAVYLILFIFLGACSSKSKHEISFYYWKQDFSLNTNQQEILKTNDVKKLYVKFFDVTWDAETESAIPISKLEFDKKPESLKIIPCIYIENQVFKNSSNEFLPKKVLELITKIAKVNSLKIDEIQIDCDWTDATRKAYFDFLTRLKELTKNRQSITSTLRLHQFKYPKKTGVPPVSKAVLMCYNMNEIKDNQTTNSIISENTLKKYIDESEEYPLPLDLALPSYHWGLIYRLGKLTIIVNDIDKKSIQSFAFSKLSENKYKADSNFYYNNTYFCKDDILRIEESTPTTLLRCADILHNSKHHFNEVIFYHISSNSIKQYEKNFFSDLTSRIR